MNARILSESTESQTAQAHARLKPELAALKAAELRRLNVKIPEATKQVLAALPGLRALGSQLDRALPTFDQRLFDKLKDCALVLNASHARYLAAATERDEAPRVLAEATKLRKLLSSIAALLCTRGLIKPSELNKIKGGSGYLNTAKDLARLHFLLLGAIPQLDSKVVVTAAELQRAFELSAEIQALLERRGSSDSSSADPGNERVRVFTLLFNTYTEVRRAVGYLRAAQGDCDVLAPPLGRTARSRRVLA